MERTNFLTKLVAALLFIAMLAYIGVYLYNSASKNIRTAPAVYVELKDSVSVSGIVVRRERLISSDERYIHISAESGKLVAAGEAIAVAYSGEAALERAGRIRELELQRQYIEAAISGGGSEAERLRRDSSIRSAITALGAAAARREMTPLSEAAVMLTSLVMDNPGIYTTQADLSLVTEELNRLKQASLSDTLAITAPESGLFFAHADGYEYLAPEDMLGVSPDGLTALFDAPQNTPDSVLGKLVNPLEWYYAAIIPFEYDRQFKMDSTATLDFGRYCSAPVQATVVSVEHKADNDFAVVFRCTGAAAEMLYARKATAEILFGSLSGIRVPKEAVYEEQVEIENSETGARELVTRNYIYTVTGLQAEKKEITIIWESADYFLAELSLRDPDSLREGNDIIITDKEIYDGMLLG